MYLHTFFILLTMIKNFTLVIALFYTPLVYGDSIYDNRFKLFNAKLSKYETVHVEVINRHTKHMTLNLKGKDF